MMAFVHDQHNRVLLKQYLESLLGLADDVLRAPLLSLLSATLVVVAATESASGVVGGIGNVFLQAGNGMEVEVVNLEVSKNDYYYIFIWSL